jgi:hypothetical protein
MPRHSLYLLAMDSAFYFWALLCLACLAAALYSWRRLSAADGEEPVPADPYGYGEADVRENFSAAPEAAAVPGPENGQLSEAAAEQAAPAEPEPAPVEELPAPEAAPVPNPAAAIPPEPAQPAAPAPAAGPAENFVRAVYDGVSGLDDRLQKLESGLARGRCDTAFAVKFLEDLSADLDTLDKAKIRARLEYLLADLKK